MKKIMVMLAMMAMMLAAGVPAMAQDNVAVQYQYNAGDQYNAAAPTGQLPPTGGSSLAALGAGVLLVGGGLLARRIVR
jgi:hypothetical protein